MFCSQCGHSNPDGASFCMACGSPLTQDTSITSEPSGDAGFQTNPDNPQTASFSSPNQSGFAPIPPYPPPYPQPGVSGPMPYTNKRKRTGLIAGLLVGAIVVMAAAVALFVWPGILVQKAPGLTGYWFSEQRGEALEFKNSGGIRVFTADNIFKGEYEYDTAQGMGVITVDDTNYEFAMTDDGLKVDGMGLYEKAGDNFDVDNFIIDMQSAQTAAPQPSEAVTAEASSAPVETAAAATQPDISGMWYETTGYGGTIEFFTDGTYSMSVADIALGGTYNYDAASASWQLHDDLTETILKASLVEDGYLNVDSLRYTRDFVEQIDWSETQDAH